ncbi:MAG: tRNA 2-thiouridine(34) synthase MnmA, partial [Ruminococcus sp.]|nr:tRNA 2-thiouridine(34) synthase MnmA [Ruminococcus sp.]
MAKKALIAMSGGVDSSVSAYLIKNQGYESTGITLKLFDNEETDEKQEKACCSLDDIEDARSVCYNLGIPYYVYNFKDSFKENVIDRFISAYENGTTPNPCIDCNRYIKFEKLIRRAEELDFDYVVTGHYAIIEYDENLQRYILKKATDITKDQSYVLYSLTQQQLAKTLFPLGKMTKNEV